MFFIFCVELCYILWSVLLHHWICIAPLEINRTIGVVLRHCFSILFEFKVNRKGCEGSGDDSWSDAESLCDSDGNPNVKCGEVVSGKRCVAWNVTRDVGWTLARRTKRMRLVGEVGWSIGECRFIFTMPVAGWRRIEFIPSATSC